VQAACIDGTDIPAWSRRDHHNTRIGLGDPEARVGRGKKGFLLGYQSLCLVDIEGIGLGHVEAPLNLNEKQLVADLLEKVLGEDIELELVAGDSQFDSGEIFRLLESHRVEHVIPWRRLRGREAPFGVLSLKSKIDVEGPEHLRCIYHRLRAPAEGLFGRAKTRLGFSGLTWQGLDNVCIHVSLVFCVFYAICIVAYRIGRPELRQSVAYFA
jgi:hypothetical protein